MPGKLVLALPKSFMPILIGFILGAWFGDNLGLSQLLNKVKMPKVGG